jgi:hypothetical protein
MLSGGGLSSVLLQRRLLAAASPRLPLPSCTESAPFDLQSVRHYSNSSSSSTPREVLAAWSQRHRLQVYTDKVSLGAVQLDRGESDPLCSGATDSHGMSDVEWELLQLPSNKKLLYEVMKSFQLNQHVLLIGETGMRLKQVVV